MISNNTAAGKTGTLLLSTVQGLLSAAWIVSISMLLAPRLGLSAVGMVSGASAIGRLLSMMADNDRSLRKYLTGPLAASLFCALFVLSCRYSPIPVLRAYGQ